MEIRSHFQLVVSKEEETAAPPAFAHLRLPQHLQNFPASERPNPTATAGGRASLRGRARLPPPQLYQTLDLNLVIHENLSCRILSRLPSSSSSSPPSRRGRGASRRVMIFGRRDGRMDGWTMSIPNDHCVVLNSVPAASLSSVSVRLLLCACLGRRGDRDSSKTESAESLT